MSFSPTNPARTCSIVNYGVDKVVGTKLMDKLGTREKDSRAVARWDGSALDFAHLQQPGGD